MSNNEKIQFFEQSHEIKEENWGGAENKVSSIAFNIPEGTVTEDIEHTHVLKEPRGLNYFKALAEKFPPETVEEKKALEKLSTYFHSQEHFINSGKDYKLMKDIFGDLLPDTQYIIGEPREGNELGFYILQKKINGKTWTEFSKSKPSEQNQEFLMQHRDQLINLIGGARKVLIETGASVDIWGDNIMVDENENFVLIDPGSPSELERHYDELTKLPKNMRILLVKNFHQKADELERYPSIIKMTNEEISEMNKKFGFTNDQYRKASKKLISRGETINA